MSDLHPEARKSLRGGVSLSSLLVIVCAVVLLAGAGYTFYITSATGPVTRTAELRVPVDLHAMDSVTWPKDFRPVNRAWGCDAGQGALCFRTNLTGVEAATELATALGSSTYKVTLGRVFGNQSSVCVDIGSTPVIAAVYPRVSNAISRDGQLVVPPRQDPQYDGFVVGAFVSESPRTQY